MPIGNAAFREPRCAFRARQQGESLVDYLVVVVLVIVGVTGIYSFFKHPLPAHGAAAVAPNARAPDMKDRTAAAKDGADHRRPDAHAGH